MPKQATPVFSLDFIRRSHKLAAYWFGAAWCPAVSRTDDGGYRIRILTRETISGHEMVTSYDYFILDPDGMVRSAPRGYAGVYKPGRIPVEDLDAAVEQGQQKSEVTDVF